MMVGISLKITGGGCWGRRHKDWPGVDYDWGPGPSLHSPLHFCVFYYYYYYYYFLSLIFLGPHPRHMEVPRLGVELEHQLLTYTTATAMPDMSCVCNLYHSSRQCQILNQLSKVRDRTCVFMDASQIR